MCQGLSNIQMNQIGIKNEIDQSIIINDLINNHIRLDFKQRQLREKILE